MQVVHKQLWDVTERIVGACIHVHRDLGPGLLESTYETCLAEELRYLGVPFQRQVPIGVVYRDIEIPRAYFADFIIDDEVLVELKSVEELHRLHVAQTLTYLKLSGLPVALLINFNAPMIKNGIRRLTRKSTA